MVLLESVQAVKSIVAPPSMDTPPPCIWLVLSESVQSVRSTVSPISSSAPPGPWVVLPEIVQSVNSDGAVPPQLANPPPLSEAVLFEIVQPVSSAQPLLVDIPLPLRSQVLPESVQSGQLDRAVIVQPAAASDAVVARDHTIGQRHCGGLTIITAIFDASAVTISTCCH